MTHCQNVIEVCMKVCRFVRTIHFKNFNSFTVAFVSSLLYRIYLDIILTNSVFLQKISFVRLLCTLLAPVSEGNSFNLCFILEKINF